MGKKTPLPQRIENLRHSFNQVKDRAGFGDDVDLMLGFQEEFLKLKVELETKLEQRKVTGGDTLMADLQSLCDDLERRIGRMLSASHAAAVQSLAARQPAAGGSGTS
jgi:hypothetical protein